MNIMSLPMSKSQSDDTSSADVEIEIISNENGKNQRKKNDDSNMTNVAFDDAVRLISEHSHTLEKQKHISDNEKLRLYSLYKRITVGPLRPTTSSRPGLFYPTARAKYDAWLSCNGITTESAQAQYINIASIALYRIDVALSTSPMTIEEISLTASSDRDFSTPTSSSSTSESDLNDAPHISASNFEISCSENNDLKRKKPLVKILPRGQIDISFNDLCLGFFTSFSLLCSPFTTKVLRQKYEGRIAHLWKNRNNEFFENDEILVSQSIRSTFDLYLQARNFPRGSEIIMSAIQIEGMVRIAIEAHGLKVVPVDCSIDTLAPSIQNILSKINDRTVAIMIAHPFGAVGKIDFKDLSQNLSKSRIDLIEDCAECFSGLQMGTVYVPYAGDPSSDVVFFSFGTIKTATALGGGVSIVRDSKLFARMKCIQDHYEEISNFSFMFKIIKTLLLLVVCKSPIIFGFIVRCLQWLGLNYEQLITSSLRGFVIEKGKSHCDRLLPLIRRKISLGNIALLERRLVHYDVENISERIRRCKIFADTVCRVTPNISLPGSMCKSHLYWLFPIVVNSPDEICSSLVKLGYDIPRGTSQLGSIDKYVDIGDECPNASSLMKSILYVPIASTPMKELDIIRMANAIRKATLNLKDERYENSAFYRILLFVLLICAPYLCVQQLLTSVIYAFTSFIAFIVLLLIFLRRYQPRSYCEESRAFAKYVGSFNRCEQGEVIEGDNENIKTGCSLVSVIDKGKQIHMKRALLTGATGFVGSMILRDLLFHRKELDIAGGVVLIVRSKGAMNARERIDKLLDHDMFSFLSNQEKNELIMTIEGDVTVPRVGMNPKDWTWLHSLSITHVYHCAASVKFNQLMDNAATSNISSSLQVQGLAKDLAAKFVYISTAFIHGNQSGSNSNPLPELLYSLGKYDAIDIYQSMMGTQALASTAMNDLGFPNTYTFSKCVCEHLLLRDQESNVVIIRPCIVGPSWNSPWEGWAGNIPSTIVAGACLFLMNPNSVWSFGPSNAPVIPVDILSKFSLSVGFSTQLLMDNPADNEQPIRIGLSKSPQEHRKIYNATWDASSPPRSQFTWEDFGFTTIQLGSACHYYSRLWAQLYHFIMTNFVWRKKMSYDFFFLLHEIFSKAPFHGLLLLQSFINPDKAKALERMSEVMDLPLLFFHFTQASFYFKSDITCPESFDAQRYMTNCILAADLFLLNRRTRKKQKYRDFNRFVIAGSSQAITSSDFWLSLTQPFGNFVIRMTGFVLRKILRRVCQEVTVDLPSFSALARIKASHGPNTYVILAPTHRSFFDFLLVSYMCFILPEIGVDIPVICAAEEFSRLPIFGWLAWIAGALFIRRGKGEDPDLALQLSKIKSRGVSTFEVFLEGARSRDRRFLCPKTGFLRGLSNTGGVHIVVPISISYEKVPEQSSLTGEIGICQKRNLSLGSLFQWLKNVFHDHVKIGRVHISAGIPEILTVNSDIRSIVNTVQIAHQENMLVSSYHIEATSRVLGIHSHVVVGALDDLNYQAWDSSSIGVTPAISLPINQTELTSIMLHLVYKLAPFFIESHPHWALWLNPQVLAYPSHKKTKSIANLVQALSEIFDDADQEVLQTINKIEKQGYTSISKRHITQYITCSIQKRTKFVLFYTAAAEIWLINNSSLSKDSAIQGNSSAVPIFKKSSTRNNNEENFASWGFKDSGFIVKTERNGNQFVVMKGDRYNISGRSLRALVPFLESQMNVKLNFTQPILSDLTPDLSIPSTEISTIILDELKNESTCEVSTLSHDRCRHGSGHTQEDIFSLRTGRLNNRRFPDAVIWPQNDLDVNNLIVFATKYNWCLIPYGGGTNVTHATWCPLKEIEPRPIVSVDMKRMNKILWVNKEDGIAHVQAGITGSKLIEELKSYRVTMGHEPDSLEFSTLGGWIATKASGMKRSKYGNIEELVTDVRVIGSHGIIQTGKGEKTLGSKKESASTHDEEISTNRERVSTGIDFCPLLFGSEGCMGIITSAKIKIFQLPQVNEYECVLLPSFSDGLKFVKDVADMRQWKPASVRLVDNEQFRLGQVLKGDEEHTFLSLLHKWKYHVMKSLVAYQYNFQQESTVSVSITFEGTREEVDFQKSAISRLSRKYGGFLAGADAGQAGYNLTFAIAYLRDFAMQYGCMGESFETFVPWSRLHGLITATKDRIVHEHSKRCLVGNPLVSCRVTQLYDTGVCVYFYYLMNFTGVPLERVSEVYAAIEDAARNEIMQQGGSLSHHHGIGKIRGRWMGMVHSRNIQTVLHDLKRSVDPKNVFGARNGSYYSPQTVKS